MSDLLNMLDQRGSGQVLQGNILDMLDSRAAGIELPRVELGPPIKQTIGVEGLPQAVKDVAGDFHPMTQMAVGGKAMWDLAAMRAKQAAGFKLTAEEENTVKANRALFEESAPAQAGGLAVGLGAMPLGLPAANFAAARLGAALPSFVKPLVAGGTLGAVANAATNPMLPGESAEKNIGMGAAGGALGSAAVGLASKLVQPIAQSAPVQKLLNANVIPTVGSAAGGFMKAMEDKLQSVPIVGDIIKSAQQRGRQELSAAAIKMATPPGENVESTGVQAIPELKQAFSRAYDKVYGNSQIGIDRQLLQDLAAAKNAPIVPMSSEEVVKFDRVIQNQILDRLPGNSTLNTADAKKVIEKNLGNAVFEAPPNSPLQKALKAARDSFRSAMNRSVGQAAADLPAINQAYSNFKDIEGAIQTADKSPGPLSGLPTPRQFQAAAKPGELRDLARAANQVMPSTVPNSGTTDRYLAALLLGGAGAAGSQTKQYQAVPGLNRLGPAFWLGLGASPLMYSRTGSRYMLGDYPGQAALAQQLGVLAPYAAQTGALLTR